MGVVCAWCCTHVRGPKDSVMISHTICWKCAAEVFAQCGIEQDESLWDLWIDLGGEG